MVDRCLITHPLPINLSFRSHVHKSECASHTMRTLTHRDRSKLLWTQFNTHSNEVLRPQLHPHVGRLKEIKTV